MTYISRGTRIIVPRWLDECDAEYELRAYRTRSDGRLKRHASCDDLRAWVNNNCINHEYLVDLMSNGEVSNCRHTRPRGSQCVLCFSFVKRGSEIRMFASTGGTFPCQLS